ncbi:MAG: hypothetical protein BWX92_01182 [Deltaproteobacteria bacterium ADurb.Bin135]|nr:MAG: hypothetical protein BWX92_01182 [Deltaproteobacteria bacterium ADurb.Bin135]
MDKEIVENVDLLDFMSFVTRPRHYGQKYMEADTEELLIFELGEACCVAAFSLVEVLKFPRRGHLFLSLMKTLSRKYYDSHQYMYDFSFTHFLWFIVLKLKKILKQELSEEDAENISMQAYVDAGVYYAHASSYSADQKDRLQTN